MKAFINNLKLFASENNKMLTIIVCYSVLFLIVLNIILKFFNLLSFKINDLLVAMVE